MRGHLHYKLAVIKPLLTVMGSFQSEVMPATADKPATATAALQSAITQTLPSVTGSSSHAHGKVHWPAQLGTLLRDKCLNLLQAEEARRKHSITAKTVFQNLSLKPPSKGPCQCGWDDCVFREAWMGPGWQLGGCAVGCEFGRVWGSPS